ESVRDRHAVGVSLIGGAVFNVIGCRLDLPEVIAHGNQPAQVVVDVGDAAEGIADNGQSAQSIEGVRDASAVRIINLNPMALIVINGLGHLLQSRDAESVGEIAGCTAVTVTIASDKVIGV